MIAGVERVVHFLVVSFPYSNMRWVVALPGETSECVCQGLLWIFERMGMAPRVVVFDNATGVGHRRPDGTVTQTRLFSCSARITGSSRGSATRIPAMRRAAWRTPSASSGAT